ncbi:MAG TPA: 2-isopropylmalate synthase [Candidatus Hypogeohydataceae bacterium YC38]|nr:2-isopropylmalate synthase [Candidatus Brocadiales bacterium]
MLRFNDLRRCLEQDDYTFELQDIKEPNLFRDIFSYGQVPKVPFNYRLSPMDPPEEIWITDTTFRDGQQSRPPFTVKQIVDLYEMLHQLGGKRGLIRQCEFFLYSDKDKEAVNKCLEKGYSYPEITGWIRANKKDFKLVKEMGLKETGILTSASDYHIFLKLGKSRQQALEEYLDIVRAALEEGIIPRCHFEDVTRADFYGFVVPFAQELMKLSEESKIPVKIRVCDTMGYGVGYPGAMLPRSVPGIIYGLIHFAKVPSQKLEWHGHNDFYCAVSNATTAWLYGCSGVNGTLLGIGERTGNTPIEALVIEYMSLRGDDSIDTTIITDIAEYFRKEIGHHIPPNQPLVGENFNVTLAGIHLDGLLKNEEIYNIFDTRKLLKIPPGVAVNDKSGAAGILHWIKTNLSVRDELTKSHPGIIKIRDWVTEQYARGRVTVVSHEEMLEQTKKHLPELFETQKAS